MTTEAADTRNIWQRLDDARKSFPTIRRTEEGQVGSRHYRYADLNTVLEAVKKPLRAEGLAIFESVGIGYLEVALVQLDHDPIAQPFKLVSIVELPTKDVTSQQLGSAITYARRYGLVALLGLTTEDDDDGATASGSRATRDGSESGSGSAAPATTVPAPPPFDAVAHGWDSEEQARSAHTALSARISALAEPNPQGWEACIGWRREHSWPVGIEAFAELEEVVRLAEGFSPSA